MIDYAVTLEFDKETENKIQELIDEVAKVTGCDYMKQSKIPPHVTVSALVSDNEAALLAEMESIAETMNEGFIWFANIGVFNPLVIYLGPVMNKFLQDTCRTVNERLLKYADDVIETANHFRCIDLIIESAKATLTEKFIKKLHQILKSGTADSRKEWFAIGDYKKLPNEVGGMETTLPEIVLLSWIKGVEPRKGIPNRYLPDGTR